MFGAGKEAPTRIQAANHLDDLWSSYWFIPSVTAVAGLALAWGLAALDRRATAAIARLPWLYTGDAEGARLMLSTIAGSVVTVAGVVFSVTIVALSFASSQMGPRLLDTFLRDKGNQAVLGVFIATFAYCLLVLGRVGSGAPDTPVPRLSVTVGLLLSVTDVGLLIWFIHHIAYAIHVERVVAAVGRELERAIDRHFPAREGGPRRSSFEQRPQGQEGLPPGFEEGARRVPNPASGYLQAVDYDLLFRLARERDLVLRVDVRPGAFVPPDRGVVSAWPGERVDGRLEARINRTVTLGINPFWGQDVEYAVNQLVTIATRALSPAVNDSFLAMFCIDRLAAAVARLARRSDPPRYRYDEGGRLRLIREPFSFSGVLDAAFHQVRQGAAGNVAVTIRLLRALAMIAGDTYREEEYAAIRRHADLIRRTGERSIEEPQDRQDVEERYREVLRNLEYRRGGAPAA